MGSSLDSAAAWGMLGQGLGVSLDRQWGRKEKGREIFVGCFLASVCLLGTKARLSELSGHGHHSSTMSSLCGWGKIVPS